MPKAISCGFIIFDRETGGILACHPTGRPGGPEMAYDIPKGHLEEDEQPLEAALRELREETGIDLPPHEYPIHEIGLVPYQKQKSLYLFSTSIQGLRHKIDRLHCNSLFTDSFGNEKPEIDGYALTADTNWFFKNLQPHVNAEVSRATLGTPVYVVEGYIGEDRIQMKVTCDSAAHDSFVSELDFMRDRNLYPYGFSGTAILADGREVSVELDDLVYGMSTGIVVDIDGRYRELPEFPISDWISGAKEGSGI